MSIEAYYPRSGLWHWLTGAAPAPLGENKWATPEEARDFSKKQNGYVRVYGITCEVVNEYSSEHPSYPWRVLCSGTGS